MTLPRDFQAAHASSFETVAAQYAAARPGYPAELFDRVEELAGRRLAGADVLDVGAGTGLATRPLYERGARVTAVEPGAAMAAQLRAALPDVPLVRARAEALPFTDDCADLVAYATSWQWTDPARSVPEALRVLRPGGALAMWWNVPDHEVAWAVEQEDRLARRLPGHPRFGKTGDAGRILDGLGFGLCHRSTYIRWVRRTDLDTHLRNLGSRSYLAAAGEAQAAAVLADEAAELLAVFPDGVVDEPYRLDVTVASAPTDG